MRNIWRSTTLPLIAGGLLAAWLGMVPAAPEAFAEAAPKPDATFDSVPVTADDFVQGDAKAPVTIIEYASLTCPHCAHFNDQVMPKVKEHYIDTGKVRFIFRDFPLDRYALVASMLARCSGRDRYFGFLHMLFRDQPRWTHDKNPMQALSQLAVLGGLGKDRFESCLKDEKTQNAVLQQRLDATRDFQVNSTPTLIINGRKYGGGLSFEQLQAIIDPLLSKS